MSGPSSIGASPGPDVEDQDGSMDSILASIRRIIMEDEAGVSAARDPHAQEEQDDELLVLKPSMMVERADKGAETMDQHAPVTPALTAAELAASLFDQEPEPPAPAPAHSVPAPAAPAAPLATQAPVAPLAIPATAAPLPQAPRAETAPSATEDAPLLAPDARRAATQSLATLQDAVRPLAAPAAAQDSGVPVLRSGGPSLEDMVRDELRGQLKLWLDANLPGMVERLVRQEIERLARPA